MAKLMRCKAGVSIVVPKAPAMSRSIAPGEVVDFDAVLYTREQGVPFTVASALAGREDAFEATAESPAYDGLPVEHEEE